MMTADYCRGDGTIGGIKGRGAIMSTHVLVIDDDPLHTRLLSFLFADADYTVSTLADPRGIGPFLHQHAIALILLAVKLPYIDGLSLCAQLRREYSDTPVILMGERGTTADLVRGFNQGADDYITKPYEAAELLARVQAVLRRYRRVDRAGIGAMVQVGKTCLDLGRLSFTAASGHAVLITPTEMRLLECLMRNAYTVIPREKLIEQTWGYDSDNADNRIDVHIRRLRHKIEAHPKDRHLIRTVRGVGYTFHGDRDEERDFA
jgi:two-component system, OmpR family, response regulator RegX3